MAKKETARIVHGYIRIKSNSDNGENCPTTNPLITEFAMGMFTAAGFSGWLYMIDANGRWNEVYISNGVPQEIDRPTLDSMNMDSFFAKELKSEFIRLVSTPYDRETDMESSYIARNTSDFYGKTVLYLSEESKKMTFPMDEVRAKFLRDDNEAAIKNAFMEEHFCQDDEGLVPNYDAYISGAANGLLCEASEGMSRYVLELEFKKYSRNNIVPDALKVERLATFIKGRFEAIDDNGIERIINGELV